MQNGTFGEARAFKESCLIWFRDMDYNTVRGHSSKPRAEMALFLDAGHPRRVRSLVSGGGILQQLPDVSRHSSQVDEVGTRYARSTVEKSLGGESYRSRPPNLGRG